MTAIAEELYETDPMRALGAEFLCSRLPPRRCGNMSAMPCGQWTVGSLSSSPAFGPIWKVRNWGIRAAVKPTDHLSPRAGGAHFIPDAQAADAAARSTHPLAKTPKPFFPQKDKSEAEKKSCAMHSLRNRPIPGTSKRPSLRIEELGSFVRDQPIAGCDCNAPAQMGNLKRRHCMANPETRTIPRW